MQKRGKSLLDDINGEFDTLKNEFASNRCFAVLLNPNNVADLKKLANQTSNRNRRKSIHKQAQQCHYNYDQQSANACTSKKQYKLQSYSRH